MKHLWWLSQNVITNITLFINYQVDKFITQTHQLLQNQLPWYKATTSYSSFNVHYHATDNCITLYKYWLVPRVTLTNNAPNLCNVRLEGNIEQLRGVIFQCWTKLTVDICFVISWNKCKIFVLSSMTQKYRICTDLPNTAVGPNNRRKCMVSRGLHHVPRKHGSCDDTALTKLGNTVYFCASWDTRWANHYRVI